MKPADVVHLRSGRLTALAVAILRAHAVPAASARIVAQSLVAASLRGYDTHGVSRLPAYIKQLAAGDIDVNAKVRVTKSRGAIATIDAGWAFGQIAARRAADEVVKRARNHGVATVVLTRSNHVGRLGEYAEQIAGRNCIALVAASVGGKTCNVAPHGGRQGVFGTNPLAWGIPASGALPAWVADFATASIAAGKLEHAVKQNARVEAGLLLDRDGRPTTDPRAYFDGGAMLPFGAHKGYSLGLLVEILGRLLVPGGLGATPAYTRTRGNWTFMTAWSIEAFGDSRDFQRSIGRLRRALKAVAPAAGYSEVMIPGENSRRILRERAKRGIPLDRKIVAELETLARPRAAFPAKSIPFKRPHSS